MHPPSSAIKYKLGTDKHDPIGPRAPRVVSLAQRYRAIRVTFSPAGPGDTRGVRDRIFLSRITQARFGLSSLGLFGRKRRVS